MEGVQSGSAVFTLSLEVWVLPVKMSIYDFIHRIEVFFLIIHRAEPLLDVQQNCVSDVGSPKMFNDFLNRVLYYKKFIVVILHTWHDSPSNDCWLNPRR